MVQRGMPPRQGASPSRSLRLIAVLAGLCLLLGLFGTLGLQNFSHSTTGIQTTPSTTPSPGLSSTGSRTPMPTSVPTPSPTAPPTSSPTPSPTATPVPTMVPTLPPPATPVPTMVPTLPPPATPVSTVVPTLPPPATPVPPPPSTVVVPPSPPSQPVNGIPVKIVVQDTFQRPNQTHWGTVPGGTSWQDDAAQNASFSIQNGTGVVRGGSDYYSAVIGPQMQDSMVVFRGSATNYQNASLGALLYWQDANNWYKAYIDGTTLGIKKNDGGTTTILARCKFTAIPNVSYTMRFLVVGSSFQVRVWRTDTIEPLTWMLTFTDDSFLSAEGMAGLRISEDPSAVVRITAFYELAV